MILGVHQDDFLEPYIKEIRRKDGDRGWAVYVNSAALSTIQKYYKSGVMRGW